MPSIMGMDAFGKLKKLSIKHNDRLKKLFQRTIG
jgi:hypothetical protein